MIWSDAECQGPWGWEGGRGQPRVYHKPMRDQVWVSQPPGLAGSPPPPGKTHRGSYGKTPLTPGIMNRKPGRDMGLGFQAFLLCSLGQHTAPGPRQNLLGLVWQSPRYGPACRELSGAQVLPSFPVLPGIAILHGGRSDTPLLGCISASHVSWAGPTPFLGCHRTGACAAG